MRDRLKPVVNYINRQEGGNDAPGRNTIEKRRGTEHKKVNQSWIWGSQRYVHAKRFHWVAISIKQNRSQGHEKNEDHVGIPL